MHKVRHPDMEQQGKPRSLHRWAVDDRDWDLMFDELSFADGDQWGDDSPLIEDWFAAGDELEDVEDWSPWLGSGSWEEGVVLRSPRLKRRRTIVRLAR